MLGTVKNPVASQRRPNDTEDNPMSIPDGVHPARSTATSDPNPFPGLMRRRRRALRMTTAAAVAVGLAVGGGAVADAATTGSTSATPPGAPTGGHPDFGGTPPVAMGTVASVGANSFTLTTKGDTTVTVDVTSTTGYLDPGVSSASLASIKVGDHVAVFGTETSDTVAATKVAIGGGPGGGPGGGHGGPGNMGGTPPVAMGTVASVGANSFTVTTENKTTVTVDVTSSTTFMEFGSGTPSLADVKVGSHVVVFGTDAANTVTATKVGIGGPSSGGPGGPGGPGGSNGHGWPGGDGMRPPTSGSTSGSSSSSSSSATSSGSSVAS